MGMCNMVVKDILLRDIYIIACLPCDIFWTLWTLWNLGFVCNYDFVSLSFVPFLKNNFNLTKHNITLSLSYVLLLHFVKPNIHWRLKYLKLFMLHCKNDKQYWFIICLLPLFIMYLLYSIEHYQHTIYIVIASILVFFIFGQAMLRSYKSKFINFLDCWLLFNLIYMYSTMLYLEITVYSILAISSSSWPFLLYWFTHLLPLQDANDSFYNSCDSFRKPMGSN